MQRVIKNWKNPDEFEMPSGYEYKPNGFGRRFMSVPQVKFRDDAFLQFGFNEIFTEPEFLNFIGNHYADGAFTHKHMDPAPEGYMHVRANWMLKKPKKGGNPILNGEEIFVDEGDLWVCFASEEFHESTKICGGERLICSFGALVKKQSDFKLSAYK